jgi:hypothetical protein
LQEGEGEKLFEKEIKPLIGEGSSISLTWENTSLAKYYRKEGREEGGKQKDLEIAQRLLQKGQSVAEITGLIFDEIQEIGKSIGK